MTAPSAPPTSDFRQALGELHRLSRCLTQEFAVTVTDTTDLPPGTRFDYDAETRVLRIRHDATLPKILHALQDCWRLIVLGPHHTTAIHRPHLHLVEPRSPMD